MALVSYHIANLLDKMTSSDKDFRFMATNDLMGELHRDSIKLDDDSERKVVKMLLNLLEDKNGEVQNLAVKCLGPLVNKVKEFQVEVVVDALCSNMVSDKEQLRDISSIGLKNVISELPTSSTTMVTSICKKITGRLTSSIAKQDDVSVQLEALDILGDLLSRFGGLLVGFHGSIKEVLLPQLTSPRMAVRKRAIVSIGYLVMSCSTGLFQELIEHLTDVLGGDSPISTTRTYIQCLGSISRQAGHRFGEHLRDIVPLVVRYCRTDDDELREFCMQAFESFVRRCPKEMSAFIAQVIDICLACICHDPNYNYEGDNDGQSMETEMDEADEEESDDEYSDDDDMSWKVRRSAAKCLESVISTRHEMLISFYRVVSPALIARFKEREENVKADIFNAYVALLRQTRQVTSNSTADIMTGADNPQVLLAGQISDLVRALHRQMKEKSVKTRQGCLGLLTELVLVIPGAFDHHMAVLVPGIQFCLGGKHTSSNMKIDTLAFLHTLLSHHHPTIFYPHLHILVPPVVCAVGDPFYKITSEALLVMQQLAKVLRPFDHSEHQVASQFDHTLYVKDIYTCTINRLKATDIDQEVKERAISCMYVPLVPTLMLSAGVWCLKGMLERQWSKKKDYVMMWKQGQVVTNLGDCLVSEMSECLPLFLDRLRNEITRLAAVKALTSIADSPLRIDLQCILNDSVPVMASFLRKNQRALKLSTLQCLDTFVRNYGSGLTPSVLKDVMNEMKALISESDLHVSQLTFQLLTSMSTATGVDTSAIGQEIMPQVLELVQSPLLQGGALQALLHFLQAIVHLRLPLLSSQELLQMLISPIYNIGSHPHPRSHTPFGYVGSSVTIHKQTFHSIAKCAAAVVQTDPFQAGGVIDMFVADIQDQHSTDSTNLFSLLAIGEIGRLIDLSGYGEIQSIITQSFSSPNEEVKAAASYALGSVSVGNLPRLLPFVLREIDTQPKRQYLLLHSLKEIISCESSNQAGVEVFKSYIQTIWSMLLKNCDCPEEGTRNVVAECLGRLTLIDPAMLLSDLQAHLSDESALTRATVVTAVKFTISDQPQSVDPILKKCFGHFLKTLQDPDLNVRRVALVTFNSAGHNKPSLIRDMLTGVLPYLYNETKVRKELIREVEMGPFKHTLDEGLDIRKAAFECMYTLLDSCLDRLDIFEFLQHVEDGLKDHYDIKMLTYLMLVRLANLCPNAVLQRLDRLVEPLRATCNMKVKAHSVKQEFEKQDELKRSALRAVAALLSVPGADKCLQMVEFLAAIRASSDLSAMFDGIQKDVLADGVSMETA